MGMKHTAYAVLILDITHTPAVVAGAAIFSEPSPTIDRPVRMAVLFKVKAATYRDAQAIASRSLESLAYDWIGHVVKSPSRGVSRVARAP
jgi:hypothetical protein